MLPKKGKHDADYTEAIATAKAKQRPTRAGKADRGIFEKVPGSGVWWIRYVDAQGRYRREIAGTWGNADMLLIKRKNEGIARAEAPRDSATPTRAICRDCIGCTRLFASIRGAGAMMNHA